MLLAKGNTAMTSPTLIGPCLISARMPPPLVTAKSAGWLNASWPYDIIASPIKFPKLVSRVRTFSRCPSNVNGI